MAKCAQHCIGKYIKGTGLEDCLVETGVFGVKVMESCLAGTHYVRSMRGIQIVSNAIEVSKWNEVWKIHDKRQFEWKITIVQELGEAFKKKDKTMCQELYEHLKG